ncbi:DUF4390 domain-containing protein [Variovorax sp. RT4R15]|uniref:DUF4390 domain-containing protein n=1 Tax=Variovorax sp. RT4R15 TaxID=3443737 RepID=UPI003F485F44
MNTTVSSTPCSKNKPADRPARRLAVWLGALLLAAWLGWLPAPAAAQAPVTEITQLRLERSGDSIYLNAAVQFDLPALVEEVLDKGIAVYFVADAELFRERWYWTDQKMAQVSRHMRLAYQPLTRRWRLNVSPVPITNAGFGATLNQNFDTLADALDAVKRIGRLRMGDVAELGDDPVHAVQFRFRLDTTQLPRPFQIGVAGQADWNITAERTAKLTVEKSR